LRGWTEPGGQAGDVEETGLSTVAALTNELAMAREAVAGRLRGVDPSDFPAMRRAYDAFAENDPMPELATSSDIDLGGVSCLGLLPKGSSGDHVVFWLHGGGFAMGSSRSHKGLASQVAAIARTAAVLPDYRLAPEHRHPAALDDCVASYAAVLKEGVEARNIILAGDSAGGGLAVATALKLKEQGVPLPAGLMLLSPWVDLEGTGESMNGGVSDDPMVAKHLIAAMAPPYLNGADPRTPLAAPLYADLRGLPPLLIQVGRRETLLDDSTRFAQRARKAGVDLTLEVWPGMIHVWQIFASELEEGREAVERIGEYLRKRFQ